MSAMYCIQVRSELIRHKSNNTHEIQTFFRAFLFSPPSSRLPLRPATHSNFRAAWTGQGVGLVL